MAPGMQSDSRSRLIIILFHLLIWAAFVILPLLFIETPEGRHRFIVFGGSNLVLMAAYFYFNYFYLIPRWLLKGKLAGYFLYLLAGVVVMCFADMAYSVFIHARFIPNIHHHSLLHYALSAVYPAILSFGLSTSIRITDEWFKNERQKKEMENEKLAAELAFLKSQVNPHFLFNILNNICALARKKSDDTEDAIIRLSRIMRYMIYDSKDEKVSLEREVEYLQNYIDLQKMRVGRVDIRFRTEGLVDQLMIEPMLLIPFVENAFKHGISYREETAIDIALSVSGNELVLMVENRIVENNNGIIGEGNGIGMKNVMRRLELLYPGRHEVTVDDRNSKYRIILKIRL
jgi:two-component system, LytTR family, sensor kinase